MGVRFEQLARELWQGATDMPLVIRVARRDACLTETTQDLYRAAYGLAQRAEMIRGYPVED